MNVTLRPTPRRQRLTARNRRRPSTTSRRTLHSNRRRSRRHSLSSNSRTVNSNARRSRRRDALSDGSWSGASHRATPMRARSTPTLQLRRMTKGSQMTPTLHRPAVNRRIINTQFRRLCFDRQLFQKLARGISKSHGIIRHRSRRPRSSRQGCVLSRHARRCTALLGSTACVRMGTVERARASHSPQRLCCTLPCRRRQPLLPLPLRNVFRLSFVQKPPKIIALIGTRKSSRGRSSGYRKRARKMRCRSTACTLTDAAQVGGHRSGLR